MTEIGEVKIMNISKIDAQVGLPILHLIEYREVRNLEEPLRVGLAYPPTAFPQLIFDFGSNDRYRVSLMEIITEVISFRLKLAGAEG